MVFENAGGITPRNDDEIMESNLNRLGSYSPELRRIAVICVDLMKPLGLHKLSMSLNDHQHTHAEPQSHQGRTAEGHKR
jgi:hypothetical protein